jgi:hypothetical protein
MVRLVLYRHLFNNPGNKRCTGGEAARTPPILPYLLRKYVYSYNNTMEGRELRSRLEVQHISTGGKLTGGYSKSSANNTNGDTLQVRCTRGIQRESYNEQDIYSSPRSNPRSR